MPTAKRLVSEGKQLIENTYHYWRKHGAKQTAFRVVAALRPSSAEAIPEVVQTGLRRHRFAEVSILSTYSIPRTSARLNLVLDRISPSAAAGEANTAVMLSALLAERVGCDLRIITRAERANELYFAEIIERMGMTLPGSVEFKLALAQSATPRFDLDVGDNELFITTSWQSTWSTQQAVGASRIIYFLQEDERRLYPAGDENQFCSELLTNSEMTFLVSSQRLFEQLVHSGATSLGQQGIWFEPVWARDGRAALASVLSQLAAKFAKGI